MSLVLHNYFRSSTSIRVRIALALKGIDYQYTSYALLKMEHRTPEFLQLNSQGLVPVLQTPDGIISQSMAILEYLDEVHPVPALLPSKAIEKARVRALTQIVAMDIHPVNNLRILKYIRSEFNVDDAQVMITTPYVFPLMLQQLWLMPVRILLYFISVSPLVVNPAVIMLCHGGPLSMPEDAEYVLKRTQNCHGFYGAPSMERRPTEIALVKWTKALKDISL